MRKRRIALLLVDDTPRFPPIAASVVVQCYPPEVPVVGTARKGAETAQGVAELRSDAVLLDVGPGPANGLDSTPRLRGAAGLVSEAPRGGH